MEGYVIASLMTFLNFVGMAATIAVLHFVTNVLLEHFGRKKLEIPRKFYAIGLAIALGASFSADKNTPKNFVERTEYPAIQRNPTTKILTESEKRMDQEKEDRRVDFDNTVNSWRKKYGQE